MTDFFALLDEPRRPWLEPDSLKKKFLARSAETHPDRAHDANTVEREETSRRFAELNAAYNCLRDPKERLRHLLELERGAKPTDFQEIPADLADLFMEVARVCREADHFLAGQARITSPLLRAQQFERAHTWTERLAALLKGIGERRDQILQQLQSLDAAWQGASPQRDARANLLRELETIYRLLGFFGRWTAQLQERMVRLAF
jgi:curved DNA-binding protein CbpA